MYGSNKSEGNSVNGIINVGVCLQEYFGGL